MKTTIRGWKNQHFKLVIDEPGVAPDECAVLAVATLQEGLGVWTVEDIRLKKYGIASPYFSVGADDYWAHWTAPNVEAAILAKGMIRESFPSTLNDSELDLNWCTFDGLVRGKTPEEAGVAKHMQNPAPLLHSYSEVRAILRDIAEFWASWPHSESDQDIRKKVSATKIHNPWRQPREDGLRFSLTMARIHQEQSETFNARVEALPRLQQTAGAAYTLHQVAAKALQGTSGHPKAVNWDQVHQDVFAKAVGQDKQPVTKVLEAIKLHSPGAVTPQQIAAVDAMGEPKKLSTLVETVAGDVAERGGLQTSPRVLRLEKNTRGRDFVIGDVHGAYDSVWRGLQTAKFDPVCDRLISVGDLVDRGSGSYRCLKFLRQPWVFAIRGNHEQMLLDLYSNGVPKEAEIQAICAATRFNNGMEWWKDVAPQTRLEIIEAFKQLPIVMELDTDRGSVGFVHADVPQRMSWHTFISKVESGDQRTIDFALGLDDRSRDRLAGDRTDGVEGVGRVFVGHTTIPGLKKLGNMYAIDTGAVFGEAGKRGHLTMVNPLAKTASLVMPAAELISVIDLRDPAVCPDAPFSAIAPVSQKSNPSPLGLGIPARPRRQEDSGPSGP